MGPIGPEESTFGSLNLFYEASRAQYPHLTRTFEKEQDTPVSPSKINTNTQDTVLTDQIQQCVKKDKPSGPGGVHSRNAGLNVRKGINDFTLTGSRKTV